MLCSCAYCGRIHESSYICPQKNQAIKDRAAKQMAYKKNRGVDKFRRTKVWLRKSKAIRQRDNYLCQACLNMCIDTTNQYNGSNLEVHHIVPLVEDFDKRLDDDNLITLCRHHHELAESNQIDRYTLRSFVKQSQRNNEQANSDEDDYSNDDEDCLVL